MTLEELKILDQVLRDPDVHDRMVRRAEYYQALEFIGREIVLKTTNFVTGEVVDPSASAETNPNKPQNLKCPDCGGEMMSRLNRQSNQRFWGCKKYPDCKGTRDVDGRSKAERNKDKDIEREVDEKPRSKSWSVR